MKRQEEKQKHGWGGRVKPKSLKALAIPDSVSKKSNINKKNSCKDLVNIINYG